MKIEVSKCDRCGRLYNSDIVSKHKEKDAKIQFINHRGNTSKYYCLCEKCADDFNKFMKNKDVKTNILREPIFHRRYENEAEHFVCPNCLKTVEIDQNFCPNCTQALDWSKYMISSYASNEI